MKATLFISILMLSFGIYAQSDTLNQRDSLGKKQGYWIIYEKDEPQKGYLAEGKISEGTYIDDRKNGQWIYYHKDGKTPKMKGVFTNDRPDGPYEKYHPNGSLREKGTFNNRKFIGKMTSYSEKGDLIREINFNENGKTHGKQIYYFENGQVQLEIIYDNGTPVDTAKYYHPNGDLKELIIRYSTGEEIVSFSKPQVIRDSLGREIYRIKEPSLVEHNLNDTSKSDSTAPVIRKYYVRDDPDKELIFEGELKYGRFWNGRHYIYDEDGLLLKIEIYKNGELVSDKPTNTYRKREDECIKKYGPNGEMNAEGEFKNGCLWNGRHFIFDKDGLLLKVEVYKEGKYHSDGQL